MICNKFANASNFKELEAILNLSKDTLVIFDIDDVLITSEDTIFSPRGERSGIKDFCLEELSKKIPINWERNSTFTNLLTIFLRDSKRRIMDENVSQLLRKIKIKSSFIGLTSLEVGSHGVIPDMIKWRQSDFKTLGIDFSTGSSVSKFEGPLSVNYISNAFFTGNVIYTDREDKGETLRLWLDFISKNDDKQAIYKPDKIIFIDDLKKNLASVSLVLDKIGIDYECIEFTGAKKLPISISQSDALWQINNLFKNRKWTRDCELDTFRQVCGALL